MTPEEFLLARIAEDEESFAATESDEWATTSADLNDGYIAWANKRMRAECAAKRLIVAACVSGLRYDVGCSEGHWADLGDILSALAQPYVDHPDYAKVKW